MPAGQVIPNTDSLAVLILLSGVRTTSPGFVLQFMQPVFDRVLHQINTTAVTNVDREIELVYLSYVVVDLGKLSQAGFRYSFSAGPVVSEFGLAGLVAVNTSAPAIQQAFFGLNRTTNLQCQGFPCSGCQS